MFKPVKNVFTVNNLGKPRDWDSSQGECISLPVYIQHGPGNSKQFISWWKPSFIERLRILFGRPLRLTIFSSAHPPVCIDCEKGTE